MNSSCLRKDIETFCASVKKLSSDIGTASSLWSDPKFSELSSSISEIAGFSKNVIVTGDKCCSSMDKFQRIAEEKY